MATGTYLAIGLNRVDPGAYAGWKGDLTACENDAKDLAAIAAQAGLTGKTLLTENATSTAVLGELFAAAKSLAAGDLLVLAYSGHGGQVKDISSDEEDQLDETWCLYDRMLIDDELDAMWRQFETGVRVFMVSDSCHSGSMAKLAMYAAYTKVKAGATAERGGTGRVKAIPFDKGWALYMSNKAMYDSLQYVAGKSTNPENGASVILISGCQDNQLSGDGDPNSVFTGVLKTVWAGGDYRRSYPEFCSDITKRMPPLQTPNYFVTGPKNRAFEAQRPFTI